MRARPARLSALTAAAALVITGALGAAPAANAEPEPEPNLTVAIVDTAGSPTQGGVVLVPTDDSGLESTIILGAEEGELDDPPTYNLASSYHEFVPPGNYAIFAITGWGGLNCFGIEPCSLTGLVGGPGGGDVKLTSALTVPETGSATFNITSELPVLRGDGTVGNVLRVDLPDGFDEVQKLLDVYMATFSDGLLGGIDLSPRVRWLRAGTPIDEASGIRYRPTAADVGKPVSAQVSYSPLLGALFSTVGGGLFPIPNDFTTNAITAKKVDTKVTLKLPKKIKKGKRAKARVSATAGGSFLSGWVRIKVKGGGSDLVMVRKGYAQLKLAKLKRGKHKVTATFLETNTYNSSHDTKKIKVKKNKRR